MKCTRQPQWVKEIITDVWEVRLPVTIWKKICSEARRRRTTKSWIVRYCVKRLISQKDPINLQETRKTLEYINAIKSALKTEHTHRHMLCLYGNDLSAICEYTRAMGITVTMLVRISLFWYLNRLNGKRVPQWSLFYAGLKDNLFCAQLFPTAMEFHSRWETITFHYDREKFIPPPRNFLAANL